MKFEEVRSNTIPIKAYSKIIYIDFDNISTQVINVLKALCHREKDNVLLIFASLAYRESNITPLLKSIDSHYYGWIFNQSCKSPDLVDHALTALQVKFMMELGEYVTKATHVLFSGDKMLATSISRNLSFAGINDFVVIKNETFQPASEKPKKIITTSDTEFVEELHGLLVNLNNKTVHLSLLGELITPPRGKLKKVLTELDIPMAGASNPRIQVQKAVEILAKHIK